ncbi:hypothetical protein DLAC_10207 [Tieghemostelium lacteum]|uniref:Uncharacterized protein n=1 Tax=Tieghemostelium lacteum TaxID=361077 RepID=A0A151Z4W9_TIELA|nr:hypothetical protein DLAC_10207 [Tieghemostelium lacteum]|eukprot:KYQ88991.1 hypothetical protein DLAC_10207 [Tieghemostelium lacteum]
MIKYLVYITVILGLLVNYYECNVQILYANCNGYANNPSIACSVDSLLDQQTPLLETVPNYPQNYTDTFYTLTYYPTVKIIQVSEPQFGNYNYMQIAYGNYSYPFISSQTSNPSFSVTGHPECIMVAQAHNIGINNQDWYYNVICNPPSNTNSHDNHKTLDHDLEIIIPIAVGGLVLIVVIIFLVRRHHHHHHHHGHHYEHI